MHNCVLYRQTRRNNSMLLNIERDFLCVCTQETSVLVKDNKFNVSFAAVPAVLKFAVLRLYWLLIRAIKFLQLQSWFITPSTMFGQLSKTLTNAASRLWSLRPDRADRMNLPKMTRRLSPKQLSVLPIFWVALLSDGLLRNCENISLPKRSYLRSALKHFAAFCMRERLSLGVTKHGKNVTIRSLSLKKTDSQVCKPAGIQRPNDFIRRVWPSGNSSSAWTKLLSYRPSETTSGHIYSSSWCSALAGVLRCTREKVVGLCSFSQTASGISGSIETFTQEVSERAANTSDFGQLLTAPQGESAAVLLQEQYSFNLDADERFMAKSYRVPVYSC